MKEAICPSCERFIGPADVCPYCDADSARPPILRRLRIGALVLAVAGLAGLLTLSRSREIPCVRMGDITPLMNFAQVRVQGTVERDAYVNKTEGRTSSVSFYLRDETGRLKVVLYREAAEALERERRVPRRNEQVSVQGSLNVMGEGVPKLRVQSPGHLEPGPAEGEGS